MESLCAIKDIHAFLIDLVSVQERYSFNENKNISSFP
jgi:hypothetical protein